MPSEPAYIRAFKDLTKGDPSIDDLQAVEEESYGQSARSCAILQASHIEMSLERALNRVWPLQQRDDV